jgi:dienelactone hydrolase
MKNSGKTGNRSGWRVRLVFLALALALSQGSPLVAGPRMLPEGELPLDVRLLPLKDLNGFFPFEPPASVEEWNERAARVRRQMQVTLGLWPMPTRTPLNAVIHGRIDCGDHTVERVFFESMPGFYVTGSLYRPKGKRGRMPGVLSAHGHWADGRFHDAGQDRVRRDIATGAERFEEGGRSPLQARCVQLARMGCVVFHYDMIGYADSVQISYELAHGFAKQRPEVNRTEGWGLYSPAAESHFQSVMGLQTWNSIRALDFLASLPDVDVDRIGVTGASGGGTQTFVLCALDERPAVSFPAVMVSTAMQGGCVCENACGFRVGTGNVEFAALFAPKPMGLTTADDWTREMSSQGYPELRQLYGLLGAGDRVMLHRGEQFGHNFNYVSRGAMYHWFNQHLGLGWETPIVEEDYRRLTQEELTVWDEAHPRPAGGVAFEQSLLRWWAEDTRRQLESAVSDPDAFRRVVGGAVEVVIGRTLGELGPDISWQESSRRERDGHVEVMRLLRNGPFGEELPVVILRPTGWNGQTVIWADVRGKAGLYEPEEGEGEARLRPEIGRLLERGLEVVGVDLLFQGEFLAEGETKERTRRVQNPRESAAYTLGYNHALFAQRVHDLLTVTRFLQDRANGKPRIVMVGLAGAGHWVAAARAVAGGAITGAAIDTGGFRFGAVRDLQDVNFLPGGARYFDLPGMLALGAPGRLWVMGEEGEGLEVVSRVYEAEKAGDQVRMTGWPGVDAGVAWLFGGE